MSKGPAREGCGVVWVGVTVYRVCVVCARGVRVVGGSDGERARWLGRFGRGWCLLTPEKERPGLGHLSLSPLEPKCTICGGGRERRLAQKGGVRAQKVKRGFTTQ